MKKFVFMVLWFILFAGPGRVPAGNAFPLQISFIPDLQLVSEEKDIRGLRLNLPFGRNRGIYGIDAGILGTAEDLAGLQVNGLANVVLGPSENHPDMTGIQVAGLVNLFGDFDITKAESVTMTGIQIAGLMNFSWLDNMDGIQMSGFMNGINDDMRGLQVSALNVTNTLTGMQCGIYNGATTVRGLQLGLVNRTDNLFGIQIGLVNYAGENPVPILPLINLRF